MKKFSSRFGIVSAGKIDEFVLGQSLVVGGEVVTPSPSFWTRFSPHRQHTLDFTVGYYVITAGGNDRFVDEEGFSLFEPYEEE